MMHPSHGSQKVYGFGDQTGGSYYTITLLGEDLGDVSQGELLDYTTFARVLLACSQGFYY